MVALHRIRVVPVLAVLIGGLEVGFSFIHHPSVVRRNSLQVPRESAPSAHAKINAYAFRRSIPRQNPMRQGYIRFVSDQSHVVRRVTTDDSSSEIDPGEANLDDGSKVECDPRSDEQGWGSIKAYFTQGKKDDGLTFKQRLAKMGVATVLSYGMISNLSYAILVALAWYIFSAKVSSIVSSHWFGFVDEKALH
jgi:hypothetical protein